MAKNKYQLVFVSDYSAAGLSTNMFSDLQKDERVIFLDGPCRIMKSKVLKFVRRVHLHFDLPLKHIWGSSLNSINWEKGVNYIIIFRAGAPSPLKLSYLRDLQKKYSISYVLLLLDSYARSPISRYYIEQSLFKYIFSFDYKDCERYGFQRTDAFYSKLELDVHCMKEEADIVCIARNHDEGNRLQTFFSIYEFLSEHNILCNFRIAKVPMAKQKYSDKIVYNKIIDYPKVVETELAANCILEVLVIGQSGATLRYYEAVCYNKKLLTNNKNVVNLPFYNPDYIHVFENPEDIDWKWVKERIPIDYHYDGRFSPTHLIDRIIELEEQKEAQGGGKEK